MGSVGEPQLLSRSNGSSWAGALDQAAEQRQVAARQGATAVASREQEELAQLQRSHQALQNRLLLERSQLGSATGTLQVTAEFLTAVLLPLARVVYKPSTGGSRVINSGLLCLAKPCTCHARLA